MKKANCLLAILLIFALMPSMAQTTEPTQPTQIKYEPEWYVGGGGNVLSTFVLHNQFYGEHALLGEFTLGYAGNVNVGYDFSKHWGFKMEVGYSTMGQKFSGTQYTEPATLDLKLSYIMIPLLVKFRVGGEKAKFYAMGGGGVGLLMSANAEYKRNGVPPEAFDNPTWGKIELAQKDIKERLNKAGGFMRVDAGVEITPTKHFMIDIGLTTSFFITDLNQHDYRMTNEDGNYLIAHNMYGGLNIGLNYRW
ncbi:MAG: outer membrane beta-barrel protein [Bacteroidetes bacterium]|nr:outer membrane beta-barrel protein [Bacteroidota bacterium]